MMPRDDDQHRFLYKLGEGAYGVVYLAEDTIGGEMVAIKIPKVSDEVNLATLESSLKEEINILKSLCPPLRPHPHIVRPKGVKKFQSESGADLMGIITEFVPGNLNENTRQIMGCDLETYLVGYPRRPDIDKAKLVTAFVQVCSALSHAHKLKFYHRDIKPSNILVHLPEGIVKVADWGVSKNTRQDGLWEGSFVGTPPYMAAEVLMLNEMYVPQARRSNRPIEIDHRADIYSLGITIFKIATRSHPFRKGSEIGDRNHRALQQAALASVLGEPLAAAVMKSIEFEADNRYQTADEFAEALKQALNRDPQHATPPIQVWDDEPVPPTPERIVETPSGALQARLNEALRLMHEGNKGGSAQKAYRAIVADYPNHPDAYLEFVRNCSFLPPEDVIEILSKGIQQLPQEAVLYYQRGRKLQEIGRKNEALQDLETCLRLGIAQDKASKAQRLLDRLRAQLSASSGRS